MSEGDLRRDVTSNFGNFFAHMREVSYVYDSKAFGNEYLELTGPEYGIRFVRDRGGVFIDLRTASGVFESLNDLIEKLGMPSEPEVSDLRRGFSDFEIETVKTEMPRLLIALQSQKGAREVPQSAPR